MAKTYLVAGLAICVCAAVSTNSAGAQEARRLFQTPGLILETKARIGPCDVLLFSPDGKHLLAVGDDKVVRIWKVTDSGLDAGSVQTLRWSIFREHRGNMYAMALSPDAEARHVAVGGFGIRAGSVAVLDRFTGEIKHALTKDTTTDGHSIWSIAFSPSGNHIAYGTEDGGVLLWNLAKPGAPIRLGKHDGKDAFNYVRFVTFLAEDRIVSVAQNGQVCRWDASRPGTAPATPFRFQGASLFRVAMSADRKWLAAVNQDRAADGKGKVRLELASLDGTQLKELPLPRPDDYARCVTFDPRSERLAVGLLTIPSTSFYKILANNVVMYDVRQAAPKPAAGPAGGYYAEAMAWHPDGNRLAVAGSEDYEVTLWDLRKLQAPISQVRGPGSALWDVALSKDGRQMGFRDQRTDNPVSPNHRARGDWKVFDLYARNWSVAAAKFQPVERLEQADGWTVQPTRGRDWYVVGPGKVQHMLPLDFDRDHMPTCYTFLKSTPGQPVRLAVGHYWGASVFELSKQGVRRVRLFTGHQGETSAIATSADQKTLVTASRDQTIAAWSLADWPSQPELGAKFTAQGASLLVDAVDAGSPAWEAGLNTGDEIVFFAFAGKPVEGGPAKWLERLRQPVPGLECFFRVKRPGQANPIDMLTTVRQRPLWRFFPTRDRDWVLWRWRDYYYDTSTHGDSYIGWQLNGDVDKTPESFPAEQFRRRFHDPRKIEDIITSTFVAPERVAIPEMAPPKVTIGVTGRNGTDVTVSVSVKVRDNSALFAEQPREVSVWINDYRHQQWLTVVAPFETKITIPWEKLRAGKNQIIAQAYNNAGSRGDSERAEFVNDQPAGPSHLYALIVGVSNYSKVGRGSKGESWPNLIFPRDDALSIGELLAKQKGGKLYSDVKVVLIEENKVSREAILAQFNALAKVARPNDRLVLFMAGHGYAKPAGKSSVAPGTWTFVTPQFDFAKPLETGLSSASLHNALASVPCRKLVLLDACHSGGSSDFIRELAPSEVGPVILAACDSRESAYELPFLGHGLFTQALLEACGDKFAQADKDSNGVLDADELFQYVQSRVPALVGKSQGLLGADAVQTPRRFEGNKEEVVLPVLQNTMK